MHGHGREGEETMRENRKSSLLDSLLETKSTQNAHRTRYQLWKMASLIHNWVIRNEDDFGCARNNGPTRRTLDVQSLTINSLDHFSFPSLQHCTIPVPLRCKRDVLVRDCSCDCCRNDRVAVYQYHAVLVTVSGQ